MPAPKQVALFKHVEIEGIHYYQLLTDWKDGKVACRKERGGAMEICDDGDRVFMLKCEEGGTVNKTVEYRPDPTEPKVDHSTGPKVDHSTVSKTTTEPGLATTPPPPEVEGPPATEEEELEDGHPLKPPVEVEEVTEAPIVPTGGAEPPFAVATINGSFVRVVFNGDTYERSFSSKRGATGSHKRIQAAIDAEDELALGQIVKLMGKVS